MIGYCCQTEMSGPDVQRNLDPRGLFAPHNDLSELLALFGFQLCYAEMSGILSAEEDVSLTGIRKWLKSSRVDKFPELGKGRTVSLYRRPFTLIPGVSVRKHARNHWHTPADRFRIFRRNRCARLFILRKYIDRFLARRSEGVISVMNFNHWTGGWDPTANPVKSIMIS